MKFSFKSLLPTLVILGVGASGASLCLVATAISVRWLYRLGFVVAFLASLFLVLYLWWSLFLGDARDLPEHDPHAGGRQ